MFCGFCFSNGGTDEAAALNNLKEQAQSDKRQELKSWFSDGEDSADDDEGTRRSADVASEFFNLSLMSQSSSNDQEHRLGDESSSDESAGARRVSQTGYDALDAHPHTSKIPDAVRRVSGGDSVSSSPASTGDFIKVNVKVSRLLCCYLFQFE